MKDLGAITRSDAEEFLYYEAAVLDDWRLDDWLELLTDDAHYSIPSTDCPGADTYETLAILHDDIDRIRARVKRLNSPRAHREQPHARTRRLITNVVVQSTGADEVVARSNFVVYRLKNNEVHTFIGFYLHHLVRTSDGAIRIRNRRVELDLEGLTPHGTVSFIL